jgi:hypothetical protein
MTRPSKSPIRSAARWGFLGLVTLAASALGASGCLDRPLCASTSEKTAGNLPQGISGDCAPKTTNVFVRAITQTAVDKIDLLFMIDNSISMADKQEVLQLAVPDLVERLVNPVCVDPDTGAQQAPPADINADCPPPFVREFNAIRDIHIGVISSSLGDYGAGTCVPDPQQPREPYMDEQYSDNGRMVGARPRALGGFPGIPSLNLADRPEGTPGFLRWLAPSDQPTPDIDAFAGTFQSLVRVTGEHGCGYEMSLEAWYRFLVDPNPPADFQTGPCEEGSTSMCTRPVGTDDALLEQRKAFLRSDSLLAIVMLSDENDCSIQGSHQSYYSARRDINLHRGTPICATNPNDPCCYSCQTRVPDACPNKEKPPECAQSALTTSQDSLNLRCFEQKRRFGVDFLYPVQRYVNALREANLCPRDASLDPTSPRCGSQDLVANPLYQDLSGAGGAVRGQQLVFLAGIIGVPWQDIQADADGEGNPYPPDELHYLKASQMRDRDTWAEILGDPQPGEGAAPILPLNPLMREDIRPRSGVTPSTGEPLAPPGAGHMANSVNGHEWDILENDDLQYACIFPLAQEKDCPPDGVFGCDCRRKNDEINSETLLNPLCQAPDGSYSTVQRYAKAYPGLRFLQTLRDFGDNSIVASICPKTTRPEDRQLQSFGYRPAVGAIIDRLKDALQGTCLPREITITAEGNVPCSVVEAVPEANKGCNRPGRAPASEVVITASLARLEQLGQCGGALRPCSTSSWTICEIKPSVSDTNGDGTPDCLQDGVTPSDVGWCYVDPDRGFGDDELVKTCPPNQKRILRFVDPDSNTPERGATALIACLGADLAE